MYAGIEIFRTGDHTSAEGRRKTYTPADLDRIAAYDRDHHEAPVVIGHPASNAPAYGWVSRVYREGEVLKADLADMDPGFVELLRAGRFKKRSISLYPDGTLRHVGFLGAVPPSVKGLKDATFAEAAADTYSFEDACAVTLLARLRDWLSAHLGPETPQDAHAEPTLDARLLAKDAEIAALTARLAAASEARRDFAQFAEQHITRILPANRERVIGVMTALAASQPVQFAEPGGQAAERAPLELFQELVRALPHQVTLGEYATRERAAPASSEPTARDMAEKISAKRRLLSRSGRRVSFADAQRAVLSERR